MPATFQTVGCLLASKYASYSREEHQTFIFASVVKLQAGFNGVHGLAEAGFYRASK